MLISSTPCFSDGAHRFLVCLMNVMKAIEALDKVYYAPLKRNRLVSRSVDSDYQRVETLTWTDTQAIEGQLAHLKKFPKGHQVKVLISFLS